jgi:hypothetical protein
MGDKAIHWKSDFLNLTDEQPGVIRWADADIKKKRRE